MTTTPSPTDSPRTSPADSAPTTDTGRHGAPHRWLRVAATLAAAASLGACAVVPSPHGPVVVPMRPAVVVAAPVVVPPPVVTVAPRWGYWHRGYYPHRHY